MYDVFAIGTVIIDAIIRGFDKNPASMTGYRADSCDLCPGGEAVNSSIASAKLGMRTGVLGFTGTDGAGNIVRTTLINSSVDTSFLIEDPDHPTPVTTMFVNADGSRKSITNNAHRYNFRPDLHLDCLKDTRAVMLGSLFRAPFDDPSIIHSVLKRAKEKNVLTFADTKLPNFRALTLDDIRDSLPLIDWITPNEDEARYFTKEEEPEKMADVFLRYGVKNVVIKLGAKGCFFKNELQKISLPAEKIHAVDATGAGDNFLAGLVSELLRGSPIPDALRFANVCGAICTTAVGAGTALKNREQVLEFIKKADSSS